MKKTLYNFILLVQPALYCEEYPVLSYLITLRSEKVGHVTQRSVSQNETEVALGPTNGLIVNQKYEYAVTAINIIGNSSSKWGVIGKSKYHNIVTVTVGHHSVLFSSSTLPILLISLSIFITIL